VTPDAGAQRGALRPADGSGPRELPRYRSAQGRWVVAPGIGWLIAARAVQGIGGALMTPASLAIIEAAFQPGDRTRAIGTWAGFSGVSSAIAPFLGGWLLEAGS
jgi:MFS family permease